MDDNGKGLQEIKTLLLTLADSLAGLLSVLRNIFKTMAVVFSVVLLGWLAALAWLMSS